MRKGDDGEKENGGKNKDYLVATNLVASRPPERRPTATLTARANFVEFCWETAKILLTLSLLWWCKVIFM